MTAAMDNEANNGQLRNDMMPLVSLTPRLKTSVSEPTYPKVENERLRAHGRGFHRDEREEQACHDGNDRSQKEKALLALYHCSSTLSLAGSRQ